MGRGKAPGKARPTKAKEKATPAGELSKLRRELAAKERELVEAVEQQNATAEILHTIASAPAEAEKALDLIALTTARRFRAASVAIRRQGQPLVSFKRRRLKFP